jgi:hypothetical protein
MSMSDDRTKTGPQDASRINLSEDYEVAYWTQTLGVSRETLERAVAQAGVGADAVRAFLQRGAH